MNNSKIQIGIIGSAGPEEYPNKKPNKKAYQWAEELGKLVAKKEAVLVCGGKGGIMEGACRGAKEFNGITVGIISGNDRFSANHYVDVEVVSGMLNCAEESLIISMSDALIVLGGGSGTLQEIAIAYRNNKPLVVLKGLDGWGEKLAGTYLDYRRKFKILSVDTPEQAIELVFNKLLSSGGQR